MYRLQEKDLVSLGDIFDCNLTAAEFSVNLTWNINIIKTSIKLAVDTFCIEKNVVFIITVLQEIYIHISNKPNGMYEKFAGTLLSVRNGELFWKWIKKP